MEESSILQRIARAEAAIGMGSGSASSTSTILQRLAAIEAAIGIGPTHALAPTGTFANPLTQRPRRRREQVVVEEIPLSFDLLVHSLFSSPVEDLANFTCVSRHWKRATTEVVRRRFDLLASHGTRGSFRPSDMWTRLGRTTNDLASVKFLARIEDDYERLPALLAGINPQHSLSISNALRRVHEEVYYLHMGLVFQTVSDLRRYDARHAESYLYCLIKKLGESKPPPEELAHFTGHLCAGLRGVEDTFDTEATLALMAQLPPGEIDQHVNLLTPYVRPTGGGNGFSLADPTRRALAGLLKASPPVMAAHAAEIRAAAEAVEADAMASREVRKLARDVLTKLPA